ncbi:MAG: hypothetical protein WC142_08820 [Bacteroidales bacterium]|jgi:hypothetical protein|nr:hypothetical protein [Bacteroidales bacterium]MDD3331196.1 hypothetical protein [Bacteroidales bacterium]MDD3692132.1 hypothetical protein [Bacteroidales bacterium]MDX9889424.1 hypothetical protein [Bacteroidales bacterium]
MKNIENNNVLRNKYKTNDLLTFSMTFVGLYALMVVYAANNFVLFSAIWNRILFILSFLFFILLLSTHLYLFSLNRRINPTKAVIKNIKKINIIYIFLIYIKVVFLTIVIPLQLAVIFILLNDKLQVFFSLMIIVLFVLFAGSIAMGICLYHKKKKELRILKDELKEIKES